MVDRYRHRVLGIFKCAHALVTKCIQLHHNVSVVSACMQHRLYDTVIWISHSSGKSSLHDKKKLRKHLVNHASRGKGWKKFRGDALRNPFYSNSPNVIWETGPGCERLPIKNEYFISPGIMIIFPPADRRYACVDDLRIAYAQYSYSLLLTLSSFLPFPLTPSFQVYREGALSPSPLFLSLCSLPPDLKTFQITLGIKILSLLRLFSSFFVTIEGNEE